jgi:hypothetical protein
MMTVAVVIEVLDVYYQLGPATVVAYKFGQTISSV